MTVCYIVGAFLVAVVVLYGLLELHYFLRTFLSVLLARFCKKKVHILQETVVKGYCFTNDLDIMFLHMNNARYVRELDFARFHFYDRTGLYKKIVDGKGTVVQSACSIRYRRPISIFTPFTVTTKVSKLSNI
ncbi:protein THEM6-like isoform X2 [Agrilus planipennis]|uniref:Protein THEM6 n=1 Tax=Agrilus planipennis TaxID=224129 RepID=A0A7F5R5B7_AGRPL|nr:protein THEM6-like isoform X2 [Agrilus planipennis]